MIWKPYLKIIRPVNLLIMVIMLLLVRYAIFFPVFKQNNLQGLMPGWQFMMLIAATLFIAAGGYIINDVLDIELDRVNKPEEQVIGKQISEVKGNNLHFNLTAIGLGFGLAFSYFANNIFLAVIFVIIATALFYYSFKYKYLPLVGNLVVALLAATVVMIYWLFEFYNLKSQPELFIDASLSFHQLNRFVLAFAFFAFLTTLTREIIKDAQDIEGDKRFGCRTLPVILGSKSTRFIVLAMEIITIGTVAWFQVNLWKTGYSLMAYILGATQLLLLYSTSLTLTIKDKKAWGRLSLVFKLLMVSGMLSLIAIWFN
jgi:4-hydroxybenzoate polyprenyltransferase